MGSAQLLFVIRQRCLAHILGHGSPSHGPHWLRGFHKCLQRSREAVREEGFGDFGDPWGRGWCWGEKILKGKYKRLLLLDGKWVYGSWNKILAWQSAVNSWGCYYPEWDWGKEETWFVGNYVDGAQLLPPAGSSRIIGIFCLAEKGLYCDPNMMQTLNQESNQWQLPIFWTFPSLLI